MSADVGDGRGEPARLREPDDPKAKVTVRRLLNHTAGLRESASLLEPPSGTGSKGDHPIRPARLVEIATSPGYEFTPGTSWNYPNTNYIVAGLLVEAVTGTMLSEQLEQRNSKRLGLGHSSFPTSTDISGGHARGYELTGSGDYDDVTPIQTSYAWAAGAIVGSTNDVSRFFRALLAGQLLEPEEREAMMHMTDTAMGTASTDGTFTGALLWGMTAAFLAITASRITPKTTRSPPRAGEHGAVRGRRQRRDDGANDALCSQPDPAEESGMVRWSKRAARVVALIVSLRRLDGRAVGTTSHRSAKPLAAGRRLTPLPSDAEAGPPSRSWEI